MFIVIIFIFFFIPPLNKSNLLATATDQLTIQQVVQGDFGRFITLQFFLSKVFFLSRFKFAIVVMLCFSSVFHLFFIYLFRSC